MIVSKSMLWKIVIRTGVFLILFFFLFAPDKPILQTHGRVAEHIHTDKVNIDVIQETNNVGVIDMFDTTKNVLNNQEHASGVSEEVLQDRIELLCTFYKDLCDKVTFDGTYSIQEQYTYLLLILYSVKIIDQNRVLETPNTLRNALSSIRLYKDSKGRRGSAGTTHVNMNTQKIGNYKEFWEVFIHEVGGHIQDLGVITDYNSPGLHPEFTEFGELKFGLNDWSLEFYKISRINENTRKPDASYKDFVSGYAMKDTFEELAEFANAWINHHDLLVELTKKNIKMKQKYDLFSELLGDRYFEDDKETLPEFDSNERVFDSTKSWKNVK